MRRRALQAAHNHTLYFGQRARFHVCVSARAAIAPNSLNEVELAALCAHWSTCNSRSCNRHTIVSTDRDKKWSKLLSFNLTLECYEINCVVFTSLDCVRSSQIDWAIIQLSDKRIDSTVNDSATRARQWCRLNFLGVTFDFVILWMVSFVGSLAYENCIAPHSTYEPTYHIISWRSA